MHAAGEEYDDELVENDEPQSSMDASLVTQSLSAKKLEIRRKIEDVLEAKRLREEFGQD